MRGPRLELLSDVRIVALFFHLWRDSYPNQHFRGKKRALPKLVVETCTHFTLPLANTLLPSKLEPEFDCYDVAGKFDGSGDTGWNSRSRVTRTCLLNGLPLDVVICTFVTVPSRRI